MRHAFDPVDEATPRDRQIYLFDFIYRILEAEFSFEDKETALHFFQQLRQLFKGWNSVPWNTDEFKASEREIGALLGTRIRER